MDVQELVNPLSDFGECGMESANDVSLHAHSRVYNLNYARLAKIDIPLDLAIHPTSQRFFLDRFY
jgi:hypothetical protein